MHVLPRLQGRQTSLIERPTVSDEKTARDACSFSALSADVAAALAAVAGLPALAGDAGESSSAGTAAEAEDTDAKEGGK